MIKLPDVIKQFYYSGKGEVTGINYVGYFKAKVLLTHGEKLEVERIYAQLLPNDKNVSSDNKLRAAALAELQVRIVEAPTWWTNSQYGQSLLDTQVLWELTIKIQELAEEWKKQVSDLVSKIPPVAAPSDDKNNNKS